MGDWRGTESWSLWLQFFRRVTVCSTTAHSLYLSRLLKYGQLMILHTSKVHTNEVHTNKVHTNVLSCRCYPPYSATVLFPMIHSGPPVFHFRLSVYLAASTVAPLAHQS